MDGWCGTRAVSRRPPKVRGQMGRRAQVKHHQNTCPFSSPCRKTAQQPGWPCLRRRELTVTNESACPHPHARARSWREKDTEATAALSTSLPSHVGVGLSCLVLSLSVLPCPARLAGPQSLLISLVISFSCLSFFLCLPLFPSLFFFPLSLNGKAHHQYRQTRPREDHYKLGGSIR